MKINVFAGAVLALAMGGIFTDVVYAQGQGQVEVDQKLPVTDLADGIQLGSFLILPDIAISQMYDSNIFAARDNEVDDTLTILYPGISGKSTWDEHELKFSAGGAFAQYYSNNDEDYDDYWADLNGRYDILEQTNVFGGAGFSSLHEDRSSPDDQFAGEKPTTYDSINAHIGISHQIRKVELRVGGTFERLDFDNVPNLHNDDRDRDMLGAGGRLTYPLSNRYELFLQGVWDKRDYDGQPDDNGFRRDSDGYRAGAGVKARFSNRLRGELEAGKLSQDYDDPRFSTVSKPDFGGRLDWLVSPRTKVSAKLSRSLEETTLFGASSYLHTALSADLSHRITSRLRVTADMSVGREDYQDVSREDDVYGGQFALRYFLDPRFYIGAGYRVTSRDSNLTEAVANPASQQDTADYGRNQVFISLGTLLYPVQKSGFAEGADRLSLPRVGAGWPGLYAGAQLGYDAFHIRTDGEGGSGANRADYGDRDAEAGLFAGYGIDLSHWYLGVELDASKNRVDINHSEDKPDGRSLSAEHEHSYGLTARLGYTVPNGVLLYGRAGAVRSKLKVDYKVNNLPENAVDESTNQTGIRYGFGADVPASERLFVRLDYSYTNFDSYEADVVTEVEKLDPDQNLFRLGLGWRFGGAADKKSGAAPVERNGFYAGTHVGHGSLNSDLTGTHFEGSGAGLSGPFDFDGDFGAQTGVTGGVFAGYGLTWRRWYAGLEAELEMSTAKWKQRRASGGRNFSLEKKDTSGLSLRGGYLLDNGTLLYLRAGGVDTRFNTEWDRGNNADNDVDRDDTKFGTRVGLGAEIPLNKHSFARLDYTYTNYENYNFVTSHSSPDDMEFANSETLFRLGLGVQF